MNIRRKARRSMGTRTARRNGTKTNNIKARKVKPKSRINGIIASMESKV